MSPVSLTLGDEVPHIFTRKLRLRPLEFLILGAKRLFATQSAQNGHAVVTRRCALLAVEPTWRIYEYAPSARSHHFGPSKNWTLMPDKPMTAMQAATLKRLAKAANERAAFEPNLTRVQTERRIAALTLKLRLEAALEVGLEETLPGSDVVAVTEPRRR
jgi:Protein of unknown function (DUF3072)